MRFRHILGDSGANSGGERKSKWAEKSCVKKSKERGEELFWVPEDDFVLI